MKRTAVIINFEEYKGKKFIFNRKVSKRVKSGKDFFTKVKRFMTFEGTFIYNLYISAITLSVVLSLFRKLRR